MRISVDETDPGYRPDHAQFGITVDGQVCRLCVTADEEEGFAICFVRGESGELLHDPDRPGYLMRREKRGDVKIYPLS